jgi:hypothetical protein
MGGKSRWDYLKAIYSRYKKVSKPLRARILDEFCQVCGYNRKYAIRLLNGPAPQKPETTTRQGRRPTYGAKVIVSLTVIWEAAGYPCSARLKALLSLWLPWASKRLAMSEQVQKQLLAISPATIDRRLQTKKRQLKRRLYGRTKPGTLLKHHIPIKNRFLGCQNSRLHRNRSGLAFRQLRKRRVHPLAQRHRHSHHLGGNSRRQWAKAKQECLTQ